MIYCLTLDDSITVGESSFPGRTLVLPVSSGSAYRINGFTWTATDTTNCFFEHESEDYPRIPASYLLRGTSVSGGESCSAIPARCIEDDIWAGIRNLGAGVARQMWPGEQAAIRAGSWSVQGWNFWVEGPAVGDCTPSVTHTLLIDVVQIKMTASMEKEALERLLFAPCA